mgnify:CR=1 FL=1
MERDYEITDFVHRYKAATDDMLAEKFFGLERRNANVLRVARKLVQRKYLKRIKLRGHESYLVATRKACSLLGENERTPKPLTEQSLPASLAIAYYCIRNGVQRFRGNEWARLFPLMHKPGLDASRYYGWPEDQVFDEFDQDSEGYYSIRFGVFMVDHGGTANRIKGKLYKFFDKREDLHLFMDLVDEEMVEITILTGLPGQSNIVKRHLGEFSYRGARIQVVEIPELGHLLTMK